MQLGSEKPVWQYSALELAKSFRANCLTPELALHSCQARLRQLDDRLHIMITQHADAIGQARASTERWRAGRPLSALDGVPIAIKDNLLTRDMPTSWGNPVLAKRPGLVDEIAVSRLRAAGLVILGKTSVPEFTLEGFTANPLVGVTGNPWQPALTPGGSSGGSVAGLASGCFSLTIGTDGGGSIRRPAAYTGLVGLKPSIGQIPRDETLPALLLDFEVVGPIARDVSDLRALFSILSGPDKRDRLSISHANAESAGDKPPKILFVPKLGAHPIDQKITAAVKRAADGLTQLGCVVSENSLPLDLDDIDQAWPSLGQVGLASLAESDPSIVAAASIRYQEMAQAGKNYSSTYMLSVMNTVRTLRRASDALFADVDWIMMPSCAAMPWPADQAFPATIDKQEVGPRGHAVFTGWVNAAGLPAINLPAPVGINDMPIGFQLIGPWGSDNRLIDLAYRFEQAQPTANRWPDAVL